MCDCFLCFRTYAWTCVVVSKEDFSNIFAKSNSLERLLQVPRVWMYRSELMVWPRGIAPPPSKKIQWPWTFPAEGVASRRSCMMPFHRLSLLSAFQSDGSIIHPQWRSATNNFHHQSRRRENLKKNFFPHNSIIFGYTSWSPTITHFWISEDISNVVHTSLGYWVLSCKLYGFNTSVVSKELISTLKQRLSDCCCWLAGAPLGLTQNLQFAKPNDQVLLSTALTSYTF